MSRALPSLVEFLENACKKAISEELFVCANSLGIHTPPARLPYLPNGTALRIMMFCDFESLRDLSCTDHYLLLLPALEWFQIILELQLTPVDTWHQIYHSTSFAASVRKSIDSPATTAYQRPTSLNSLSFSGMRRMLSVDQSPRQDVQDMLSPRAGKVK